ncbi:MAG: hypothetical protein ACXVSL_16965, partial [Solirubrobacteraceae bacterium]
HHPQPGFSRVDGVDLSAPPGTPLSAGIVPAQAVPEAEMSPGPGAVAFESMPAHFPPDECAFKGLPDDRCQCDHWGYLFKRSFRVTYKDGPEEIIREARPRRTRDHGVRREHHGAAARLQTRSHDESESGQEEQYVACSASAGSPGRLRASGVERCRGVMAAGRRPPSETR